MGSAIVSAEYGRKHQRPHGAHVEGGKHLVVLHVIAETLTRTFLCQIMAMIILGGLLIFILNLFGWFNNNFRGEEPSSSSHT